MTDVERLIQIYKSIISKNKTLKELVKSAKDWEAVYSYAQGIGEAASQSIISSGMASEDLEADLIAIGMISFPKSVLSLSKTSSIVAALKM